MEVEYDEENDFHSVYIDKDDICMWCEQQYGCPLIECLGNGLVTASEPIRVLDCRHYLKFDNM